MADMGVMLSGPPPLAPPPRMGVVRCAEKAPAGACKACYGRGWVLWVFPERKPRPAYWFDRGPNGERPSVCGCNE